MNLKELGWEKYRQTLEENIDEQNVARVAVENRGAYLLYASGGQLQGIIQGKFIKTTQSEADYPKVGDWVLMEKLAGEPKAIIKKILPRISKLSRQRISKDKSEIHQKQEEQIMATNIDVVFVVQSLDGDYNVARLERYMDAIKNGGSQAVILLNKCDIAADAQEKLSEIKNLFPNTQQFLISAKTGFGMETVRALIDQESSVVFVGSSGVGKSTLINKLLGIDLQKTQAVRMDDSKGRHTTTKRELFLLPTGGVLIDTPGIRELMPWDEQKNKIKKPDKAAHKFTKPRKNFTLSDED